MKKREKILAIIAVLLVVVGATVAFASKGDLLTGFMRLKDYNFVKMSPKTNINLDIVKSAAPATYGEVANGLGELRAKMFGEENITAYTSCGEKGTATAYGYCYIKSLGKDLEGTPYGTFLKRGQAAELYNSVFDLWFIEEIAKGSDFTDVTGHEYLIPINILGKIGITGISAGQKFVPDGDLLKSSNEFWTNNLKSFFAKNITRGELAKDLVIAANIYPLVSPAVPAFTDVPKSSKYYEYIETALAHEIVKGDTNNTFGPNNTVTRAEAAKAAVIAFDLDGKSQETPRYSDVSTEDWVYQYVEILVSRDIIPGSGTKFYPSDIIKTGDLLVWIVNLRNL